MEQKKYYISITKTQTDKQNVLFAIDMCLHRFEKQLTDEGKEILFSALKDMELGNIDKINLKMLSLTEKEANELAASLQEQGMTLEVRVHGEGLNMLEPTTGIVTEMSKPEVPKPKVPEPKRENGIIPEPIRTAPPLSMPEPRVPRPRIPEPKVPAPKKLEPSTTAEEKSMESKTAEPKTAMTLDLAGESAKKSIDTTDLKNKFSAGMNILQKSAGEQKEKAGEFLTVKKEEAAKKKAEKKAAREKEEQEEAAKPNPNAGKQVVNTRNKIKYKFRQTYCETGKKPFTFLDAFLLSFLALAAGYGVSFLLVRIIGEYEILILIGFILGALICWILDYLILFKKVKGKAKGLIAYNILASIAFFCTFFLWPLFKFSYSLGKAMFYANVGNTAASVHASKNSNPGNSKSSFDWFEYDKYIQ